MKNLAKLLCIVILLAIPAVVLAQRSSGGNFYYDNGSGITGKIVSIDKGDKAIEIYDRSNQHYTVLADNARIYGGDKRRDFNDLKVGDLIRVDGRDRGRSIIEARAIYGVGSADQPYDRYYGDSQFYGRIRSTNKRDNMQVDANIGKIKVVTTRETEIFDGRGRRIEFRDLGTDDTVSIQGYQSKNNEIVAYVIRIGGGGSGWQTSGRHDSFEGRVVRETSPVDRRLRIEPTGWNQKLNDVIDIDVAKDADVIRAGRRISVHDISRDETIYVEGNWSASTFVAIRVEVVGYGGSWRGSGRDSKGYASTEGRITDIDYRNRVIAVETRDGDLKVYCDRAKIWNNGREYEINDLKRGDTIRIEGTVRGNTIDATRIETGRASGWWLDRDRT